MINLGWRVTDKGNKYSEQSLSEATNKALEWGLDSTWNNKADAYRHFIWNVKMTRDSGVGYYHARNITNRHEYETMTNNGWIANDSQGFEYLKDNTIIKGKMNQEILMDLWNNQVGRELANNIAHADKTEEELFDLAVYWDLLITDANKVYELLEITDFITDGYLVDAEWDLTTGSVTVKKDGRDKTLKMGV